VRDPRAARVIAPIRVEVWRLRAAIAASLRDAVPVSEKRPESARAIEQ
jgi:hypothetical protein